MPIRFRFAFAYTLILAITLTLFGGAVYFISRQMLLDEIDSNLTLILKSILKETEATLLGDLTVLTIPEEVSTFDMATVFFTISDSKGKLKIASPNLNGFEQMLDPQSLYPTPTPHYSITTVQGQQLRVLSWPLLVNEQVSLEPIGYLQIASLMDSYYSAMERLRLILVFVGIAAIALSLAAGFWLTQSLLKPINVISEVALQITRATDLGRRLPDSGRQDEIGQLTTALNTAFERLENSFRAQQRFLADVSHELRTPLTALRGNVDLMQHMGEVDPESLTAMREELERMTRLVGDLLFLARTDAGGFPIQRQPVDLDTIFLDVYKQALRLAHPHQVQVQLVEMDQARILGDGDRLRQLLLNLVDNGIKYTPVGGKVQLSLVKESSRVKVVVADTGMGIPEQDMLLIFERFYRVDKARNRAMGGAGLGLSIAWWIAQAHGGEIKVSSEVGKGTVFEVYLPLLPQVVKLPALSPKTNVTITEPRLTSRSLLNWNGQARSETPSQESSESAGKT